MKSQREKNKLGKLFALWLLFPFAAFAAGFSAKEIFFQVLNFSLFAAALFFLTRSAVRVFFHKRRADFLSFEKQAAELEKEKRLEHEEWSRKLSDLKARDKNIKDKALAEGESFAAEKRAQIEALQAQLKKETDFFIYMEKEKAKRDLLQAWKSKVAAAAEKELEYRAKAASFQKDRLRDFFKQIAARI